MKENETDRTDLEQQSAETPLTIDLTSAEAPQTEGREAEPASRAPQEGEEKSSKEKLLASLLSEEGEKNPSDVQQLRDVMKALSIDGLWFRRQLGVIGLILLGVVLYITCRYLAQQQMIEEDKLNSELQDWKYRSMTISSDLTFRCRQSQIEEQLKALGDSTLTTSDAAPYILEDNE